MIHSYLACGTYSVLLVSGVLALAVPALQVLDVLDKYLTTEEKDDLYVKFDQGLKDAPLYPHPYLGGTTAIPAKIMHPLAGEVPETCVAC